MRKREKCKVYLEISSRAVKSSRTSLRLTYNMFMQHVDHLVGVWLPLVRAARTTIFAVDSWEINEAG